MKQKKIPSILLSAAMLVAALSVPRPTAAQDAKHLYASMAPLEQYLMDHDAEIALARSSAPDAISHDATVLVLGRHGYETAVEGKNGWVCMNADGWLHSTVQNFGTRNSWRELSESAGRAVHAPICL